MVHKVPNRVALLVVGFSLLAAGIALRLVQLQVLRAEALRTQARRQHEQVILVGGRRGAILDRQGRELAVSVASSSLFVHPWRVRDPGSAASALAPVLGVPRSKLLERLRSETPFAFLKRRLDPETEKKVLALRLPIGGGQPFGFEPEAKRVYPQGRLASHVVGWANIDQKGLEGIENVYDDRLQGDSTGYLAVRDGRGGMVLKVVRPPAKQPEDLVLSLDLTLQHIVERELDRAMDRTGAHAASAVLLDPATGQVLALANRPTADPNRLGEAPSEARRNRAVTDLYEPGSTFKMVTAAAAIERGTVSPETRFDCQRGSLLLRGRRIQDVHAHGILSVREILEKSSNVGIVKVGQTLPREALRDTIISFGFGRPTGIELPGERAGLVTPVAQMSSQSPASMAMGYELGVTALQIAAAIAAVANDGVLVPPRIVLGLRDASGRFTPSPSPEPRRVVSSRTAHSLAGMLEGVVVRGTGQPAAVPGYRIAGKTGTARKHVPGQGYSHTQFVSSFAGFGPIGAPRLAGHVVLDSPSHGEYYGGLVSAPVFGRILADGLAYLRVPLQQDPWEAREEALAKARLATLRKKTRERAKPEEKTVQEESAGEYADAGPVVTGPGQVPDLRGAPLRTAIARLAALGYRTAVAGTGLVVEQHPAPGTPLASGMTCALLLAPSAEIEKSRQERDPRTSLIAPALRSTPDRREAKPRVAPLPTPLPRRNRA